MSSSKTFLAWAISSDGTAVPVEQPNASSVTATDSYVWSHIHIQHEGASQWLQNEASLDASIVETMMDEDPRPRATIQDGKVMLVLRAMNLRKGGSPEDMIPLRIWIDERRVITTHGQDIKAIEEIQASIGKGEAPATPAEFLMSIIARIFARMEPFLDDLEDLIAAAEEQIVSDGDTDLCDGMFIVRKRIAVFRRYLNPQKKVLAKLNDGSINWLDAQHRRCLGAEYDRVSHHVDELEHLTTRLQILNEEVRNAYDERLNKLAYLFSVVATIFLPLGFLTGLLGINLGGIPGMDHPYAFWIFTALCLFLGGVLIILFRRLKWF